MASSPKVTYVAATATVVGIIVTLVLAITAWASGVAHKSDLDFVPSKVFQAQQASDDQQLEQLDKRNRQELAALTKIDDRTRVIQIQIALLRGELKGGKTIP